MDHFGKRATYGSFDALTTSEFSTDATPFSSAASASTRLAQRFYSGVQIDIPTLTEQLDNIESAIKNLQQGVIDKVQCLTLLTKTLDLPVQSTLYRSPETPPWQHGDSRLGSVPFTFTPTLEAEKKLVDLDVYHMWQQNPATAMNYILRDLSSVSYFNDVSYNNSTNSGKRVTFIREDNSDEMSAFLNNRPWVTSISTLYIGQNPPACGEQVPMELVPTALHDMFYYDNVTFPLNLATYIYDDEIDDVVWSSYDMNTVNLAKVFGSSNLYISNWDVFYSSFTISEVGLLDSLPDSEKMPAHKGTSNHTSIYIKFEDATGADPTVG